MSIFYGRVYHVKIHGELAMFLIGNV